METSDAEPTVRTCGTRPIEYAVVVPDDDRFRGAVDSLEGAIEADKNAPAVLVLLVDDNTDPGLITEELGGLPGIAVSDTHAPPDPVAFFDRSHPEAFDVVASLPVENGVDVHDVRPETAFGSESHGELIEAGLVWVEIGAVDPAAFLRTVFETDDSGESPTAFYVVSDAVPGGDTTAVATPNFERVDVGTVFAEVDGDRLVANWPFFPVLFDECGVDGVVGYRAARVGTSVAEARAGLRPDSLR